MGSAHRKTGGNNNTSVLIEDTKNSEIILK
jgi:hypothetical protein